MARRFVRSRSFVRRAPGTMIWLNSNIVTSKVAIPAATAILFATLDAGALLLRPFTVVRTRVNWWSISDQTTALEEPQLAMGWMKVNDSAVSVGITAIPDPINNTDSPWFVYETAVPALQIATAVGFTSPAGTQRIVDSKAQRKIGPNEDLAVVIANNSAADGAFSLLLGRFLVKLH